MAIVFQSPEPMAPAISEGTGALSQYEKDRAFALQRQEQERIAQQQAFQQNQQSNQQFFQQQLDSAKFQQSQVQPFQLQQQHVQLQIQAQAAELSMAEQMRMQRLQQGLDWVQGNGPVDQGGTGLLTQEEVAAHSMQLQTGLNPFQNRMQQAQILHAQAQTQEIHDARSRTTAMDEEDATFRSTSLPNRIITMPNPAGYNGPPLQMIETQPGRFEPYNQPLVVEHMRQQNNALQRQADLHAAQAEQVGQQRQITPEVVERAHERAIQAVERNIERLRTAASATVETAASRAAASDLQAALGSREADITAHVNRGLAFVRQFAGTNPGPGGAPATPAAPASIAQQQQSVVSLSQWANSQGNPQATALASTVMRLYAMYGDRQRMPAAEQATLDAAVAQLRRMQTPQPGLLP